MPHSDDPSGNLKAFGMRALRLLEEVVLHVFGAALLLLGVRIIEQWIHMLWGVDPILLAGTPFELRLPYLFDVADIAIIAGFLTFGGYHVIMAYNS
jgi:hypothetical protein